MAESTKGELQFNDLYQLAQSKNYLTYDEVNQHLPKDVVEPAQIDEILTKLIAEYRIEIVPSD